MESQAIIMTLLVIEMPILIIELVEHAKDSQELFFNLTMDFLAIYLAALIIYDFGRCRKAYFNPLNQVRVMISSDGCNPYSADALHLPNTLHKCL